MDDRAIAVASDHAGFALKSALMADLRALASVLVDLGPDDPSPVDYPDFAYAMARAIRDGRATRGVLICGSGIGVSIAANRFPAIRAALVHDPETARLARLHNDANVICFAGRLIAPDVARACIGAFLETGFEGGRHAARVGKLSNPIG